MWNGLRRRPRERCWRPAPLVAGEGAARSPAPGPALRGLAALLALTGADEWENVEQLAELERALDRMLARNDHESDVLVLCAFVKIDDYVQAA